jgi:hypothetical protein
MVNARVNWDEMTSDSLKVALVAINRSLATQKACSSIDKHLYSVVRDHGTQ